jgi:hypothetical protein
VILNAELGANVQMANVKPSRSQHVVVTDNFTKSAKTLRKYFDQQFSDPTSVDAKRFVWDYWHIPDQYTLLRTPAYHYFPDKMYMQFHKQLVQWGRENLGCWDISPPWMSLYVDGCKQELHSDVPHGPWAYVFSLTLPKRKFSGGETQILKPETLSYWSGFSSAKDRELNSFVDRIAPEFNRLICFDARYPHSVTEVKGVHEPRDARLVIHGWFTQPKTYIDGYLDGAHVEEVLNSATDQVQEVLPDFERVLGTVAVQLNVNVTGRVSSAKFSTNTLLFENGTQPALLNKKIIKIYSGLRFNRARGSTKMTVPLILE